MLPALDDLGIDRKTEITVQPLHNLFAPRLVELPGLVDGLPGAPGREAGRPWPRWWTSCTPTDPNGY
ncbi:MAG: hypothetical protein ACRD0W_21675 [Acidimicrobiales bacterium]